MKYAPRKVFVLEDGEYIEINYARLLQEKPRYVGRRFLPLHGMLMEVSEDAYKAFYREQRRQKYLNERSNDNGDFSYDMLTTDEFNGEDILVDALLDTSGQAEKNILLDKLKKVLCELPDNERQLIDALFTQGLSEREWSAQTGIPQKTINDRKNRLLTKLRKLL